MDESGVKTHGSKTTKWTAKTSGSFSITSECVLDALVVRTIAVNNHAIFSSSTNGYINGGTLQTSGYCDF